MTNTELLRSRVMGNYHARFWSRVGRGDLSYLGNFHRSMRRLVAIELKMTSFQPAHAGQMEWYLKWLDKYERRRDEEKPLGIIICASKDQEDIELLELGKNGMHVAEYLTSLLPKDLMENKLKKAVSIARENYNKKLIDKE